MMACELKSKWVINALMSSKSPVVFTKDVYSRHLCLYYSLLLLCATLPRTCTPERMATSLTTDSSVQRKPQLP